MMFEGVSIGHTAAYTWDGKYIVFGHEPGGGSEARCQSTSSEVDRTLWFLEADTGLIYESDIKRGLIIWNLSDNAVAGARTLDHLNPQTIERPMPFKGKVERHSRGGRFRPSSPPWLPLSWIGFARDPLCRSGVLANDDEVGVVFDHVLDVGHGVSGFEDEPRRFGARVLVHRP